MEIFVPRFFIPGFIEPKDPAENKVGLFGEFHIIKKRHGVIIQEIKFRNIITDIGLQHMAGQATEYQHVKVQYCHLGTGNSTPVSTDTALQSRGYTSGIGSFIYNQGSGADRWIQGQWDFAPSQAVGNWTEIGAGWTNGSPYNVFCRSLIKDDQGNPITLQKTSADTLTIIYKIHIVRASDTSYSNTITVAGVGDIVVESLMPNLGLQYLTNESLYTINGDKDNCFLGSNNNQLSITQSKGLYYGFCRSGYSSPASLHSVQSYVAGSTYRDIVDEWPASIVGNIGEASLQYCLAGALVLPNIAMRFNPVIPKDDTKKFRLNWRITFNRIAA